MAVCLDKCSCTHNWALSFTRIVVPLHPFWDISSV